MHVSIQHRAWGLAFLLVSSWGFQLQAKEVKGPSEESINFGVVVDNDVYTLYRSAYMSESRLEDLYEHLDKKDLPHPQTIIYMNHWGYKFPFYFALQEYKTLQKGIYGEVDFYHSFGDDSTYLNGHNPYLADEDIDTKWRLGRHARKHFDLQDDGIDGGIEDLMKIMHKVLDPNRGPVLYHCFGGKHRTGMVTMIIRYLQGGHWIHGEKVKIENVLLNPAQYEYHLFNESMFRQENMDFIEKFVEDPRFQELKILYGPDLMGESRDEGEVVTF